MVLADEVERRSRYFRSAETGQVEESVAPTVTVQPVRKGSVFLSLYVQLGCGC